MTVADKKEDVPAGKVGAIMVVGGGISGMQSSLDLADSGFLVYLVETSPTIGGVMAQLDKTFPTNDCSMCIMAPKLVATGRHHNIKIVSNADIVDVTGSEGNFKVTIRKNPRKINEEKCTGCGVCTQYCPARGTDEYNENLKPRRAVFVKYAQAVPLINTIDTTLCLGCGICEYVCRAGAIDYSQEEEMITLNVGSIILSPGFSCYDPIEKGEYGYGAFPNVVTSMEFERMLSATGPSGGVVIRPSDGDIPARVAFLQCVGSRDEKAKGSYCSSVCCMYSMKEAIIAKEHAEGMDTTIFFMDLRAYGKDFEMYYVRAQDEYGIKFLRTRVASVDEDPETNNLIVKYVEDNKAKTAEFEMVVLALGFRPPESSEKLSELFGLDLNKYGYCATDTFNPIDTNVPGVFVSGAFSGPKDIPETVTNASGAAARASAVVATERDKLVTIKEYPAEKDVTVEDEPRIGVFVCHCGINIGGTVDVPDIVEYAKSLPNVVYTERNLYTCSQDTQDGIKEMIKEHDLNRVIVASCTPRTHEPLFMNTCREAGLNPYLFEFVNLREHCSWVHMHEKEKATAKAKDLVRIGVAKSRMHTPLYESYLKVIKKGLVIGGGLSGMTAALGIADQGYEVYLVEKEKELGGMARRLHYLADPNQDPQAKLKEMIKAMESNPKIKVFTGTNIKSIEGFIGAFRTVVDTGGKEETLEHGTVIVAIGGTEYKPNDEYLYGKNPAVLTQLEFEEKLYKGEIKGDTFVVIQCVGARTKDWPNCSRICCVEALKNIQRLKEKMPDTEVFILNKDIRSYGFYEEVYRDVRGKGVHFITYDDDNMPQVTEEDGKLRVDIMDGILEHRIAIKPDYLILSVAARPEPTTEEIAKMLKISTTADGYFLEAHMKLRPVDFAVEGVFLAGLAHGPKLIDEAMAQANAAVSRATTILSKEKITLEPIKSQVIMANCDGCAFCIEPCPYNALTLLEFMKKGEVKKTVEVDESACQGCGVCQATCPKEGIIVRRFRLAQLKAMIQAALEVTE